MLQNLSFRTKLIALATGVTGVSLLLAGSALVLSEHFAMRGAIVRTVEFQAGIVADSCTAAMSFDDRDTASAALLRLSTDPSVVAAHLLDAQGDVFAAFSRSGGSEPPPEDLAPHLRRFEDRTLIVARPVTLAGERIGSVCLRYDLTPLHRKTGERARLILASLGGAMVVAFLLAARLQRRLTRPVHDLADVARHVSERRDYTVRARKRDNDELGQLTESFNSMLDQIQARDAALEAARDELETAVARRTVELRRTNEQLEAEIDERRAAEDRLRHHAYHDSLTGLPNRALLIDRLERCMVRQRRKPDYGFGVLFLDLDNFKVINDSLGHEYGDELLIGVTRRLESCLRGVDTLIRQDENLAARIGGDEFVILLEGLRRPSDAAVVSKRILEHLAMPFDLNGHEVVISASIGVALGDRGYARADALLRDADLAMYRAKAAGKARYVMFDREMHVQAVDRMHLESDLRRAIESDQLLLVYQPIIDLKTGRISGFEALVRWSHPERGRMAPDDFIPIAEETGMIIALGRWVLNEACRQLRAWDDAGTFQTQISMGVNLSRRQLVESGLPEEVKEIIERHDIAGHRLNLEITESAIIENADFVVSQLERIKALGVRVHMDDFGTGYSSLSALHRLPLDVVKIDRAFMATMGESRDYVAIVHGIITIAHNLDMAVTVEGVEQSDQVAQIVALDCDYAQGYYFAAPLSVEEASAAIALEERWQRPA